LSDTRFMVKILQSLGASASLENGTLRVHAKKIKGYADYDLVRKMRGSICIAGPCWEGCARHDFPARRLHHWRAADQPAFKGLCGAGAKSKLKAAMWTRTPGNRWQLHVLGGRAGPTVLGTANIMMAAALAEGITVIESAACERKWWTWQILIAMGAQISGAGSPTITITGVKKLHGRSTR